MTREAILKFVRDYCDKEGRTPSVRTIAEAVPGVDRANFYEYFSSKSELLSSLGIETEENDLPQAAAMEARSAKGETGFRITLNESQTRQILGIAFLENKPAELVIDEILDYQREIREILDEIDEDKLTPEMIEKMLHPTEVYHGINVSSFSHSPWMMIPCRRCGGPLIYSEAINPAQWLYFLKNIATVLRAEHIKCEPTRRPSMRRPAIF